MPDIDTTTLAFNRWFTAQRKERKLTILETHIPHRLIASWNNIANLGFGVGFCKDHTAEFNEIILPMSFIAGLRTYNL